MGCTGGGVRSTGGGVRSTGVERSNKYRGVGVRGTYVHIRHFNRCTLAGIALRRASTRRVSVCASHLHAVCVSQLSVCIDPPSGEEFIHEDAKRPVVSRKVMTLRGGVQWTHSHMMSCDRGGGQ